MFSPFPKGRMDIAFVSGAGMPTAQRNDSIASQAHQLFVKLGDYSIQKHGFEIKFSFPFADVLAASGDTCLYTQRGR